MINSLMILARHESYQSASGPSSSKDQFQTEKKCHFISFQRFFAFHFPQTPRMKEIAINYDNDQTRVWDWKKDTTSFTISFNHRSLHQMASDPTRRRRRRRWSLDFQFFSRNCFFSSKIFLSMFWYQKFLITTSSSSSSSTSLASVFAKEWIETDFLHGESEAWLGSGLKD